MTVCLSASRSCEYYYGLRHMIQARNGTYHNITVDIFDSGIALVLSKLKRWASRILCWIRMD